MIFLKKRDLLALITAHVVLDLSKSRNCIIEQPGYYVLNKNWEAREGDSACATVTIRSEVTLDLRGYSITGDGSEDTPVIRIDTKSGVTDLSERSVHLTRGRLSSERLYTLEFGPMSRVSDTELHCRQSFCVRGRLSSEVRDNRLDGTGGGILLYESGNVIDGNLVLNSASNSIIVFGNDNIVARNTTKGVIGVDIDSARNVLDGNIAAGIQFKSPGNFFGNNRVARPGGFVGTEGQTDWSGSVRY